MKIEDCRVGMIVLLTASPKHRYRVDQVYQGRAPMLSVTEIGCGGSYFTGQPAFIFSPIPMTLGETE